MRPECIACLRRGHAYPGYRDELDILFRTENVFSYKSNIGRDRRRKSNTHYEDSHVFVRHVPKTPAPGMMVEKGGIPTATLTACIPVKIHGSLRDRRLIHYYCAIACTSLSKYPDMSFWTGPLLQWSVQEPVVQRCLVAYSSCYQLFRLPRDNTRIAIEPIQKVTLQEYHNALGQLRHYITPTSRPQVKEEVVLMCIAVLYSVVRGIGRLEDAKTHLRAGSDILRHWTDENMRNPSLIQQLQANDLASLLEVFSQMHLQAMMFDDMPFLSFGCSKFSGPLGTNQFHSIVEAQIALETVQSRLLQLFARIKTYKLLLPKQLSAFVITEISTVENKLISWRSSSRKVIHSAYNPSPRLKEPMGRHAALLVAQQWILSTIIKYVVPLHKGMSSSLESEAEKVFSSLKSNLVFSIT
jgi:hypothetical protein